MSKCWDENPEQRPSFAELAEFFGKLVSKEITPDAGSDEAAGYFYDRNITKGIPGNYLDVKIVVEDDDYIKVMPLPSESSTVAANHYTATPEGGAAETPDVG